MGIRAATVADLDAVLQLAVAFYAEDGFDTLESDLRAHLAVLIPSPAVRVAVAGDRVAFAVTTTGFGLESGWIAELEDLYVAPAARRRGVAEALIDDSVRWASSRGCAHLEIVVAPNGQDVSHLYRYYRKRGFADEGRRLISRDLALAPPSGRRP